MRRASHAGGEWRPWRKEQLVRERRGRAHLLLLLLLRLGVRHRSLHGRLEAAEQDGPATPGPDLRREAASITREDALVPRQRGGQMQAAQVQAASHVAVCGFQSASFSREE